MIWEADSVVADSNQELEAATADGLPSYMGYEYQILATVWIALDLVTKGQAEAIVVEPPTNEDVSADVLPTSEHADWGVKIAEVQVQIKLRQHAIWKRRGFNELLKARTRRGASGPKPRIRPLEYLNSRPSRRYLLLTNADVDRELANFCVAEIGDLSAAIRIPQARSDDPALASRIGILPPLTSDHLKAKVREILQRSCHVPGEHLDDCVRALKDAVRRRLLGELENRLSKSELLSVIREHGGSYQERLEPVHSTKHGLIKQRLGERHALVLVGPPGTGKTTIAEWLVAGLESGDPPFRRVTGVEAKDVTLVRNLLDDQDNHVFYYEDPWGQGEPPTESAILTSELPKLMRKARPGKVFVVTSRLSVFQAAIRGQENLFAAFTEQLNPEDYSPTAYRDLFDRETANWARAKRKTAENYRAEALKHLQTPYSVQVFCGSLGDALDKGKRIHRVDVEEMARESNVGAFGAVLKRAIVDEGPDAVGAAVALWATLVAQSRKIDASHASAARNLLREGGITRPPDVLKLFNSLADGRWLQSRSDGYVATPSVLESLGMFERDHPAIFTDAIGAVFQGWAKINAFDHILACLKEIGEPNSNIPTDLAHGLDQYLVSRVSTAGGYQFTYAYMDLAKYSRSDNPVAMLARALEQTVPTRGRNRWLSESEWLPSKFDASQIGVISESREARQFVERFIEFRLPEQSRHRFFGGFYEADEFLAFTDQFGWDLADCFKSTFLKSVRLPEEGTSFLAKCACKLDPAFVDTAVDECVKAVLRTHERDGAAEQEKYRQASQGEMDLAAAEWNYSEPPDWFFHAEDSLRQAVEIKNSVAGYAWVPNHEHAAYLLEPWAKCLGRETSLKELAALLACCATHSHLSPAFDALDRSPYSQMLSWLIERICEQPTQLPHNWPGVLERFSAEGTLPELLRNESHKYESPHRGLIAFELLRRRPIDTDGLELPHSVWQNIVKCVVSDDEAQLLSNYLLEDSPRVVQPLAQRDRETLGGYVKHWPDWPGICAVRALQAGGIGVSADLPSYLKAKNVEVRKLALSLCMDRSHLLQEGLNDKDFSCRVAAIRAVSPRASAEELRRLLDLSSDRSCFVREALAEQIGLHRWAEGIPSLLALLTDDLDYAGRHFEGDVNQFEVARKACHALRAFDTLPEAALRDISSFLEGCETSSRDTTVHGLLFRILADHPSVTAVAFCSRYLSTIWWESGWKDYRGQPLLPTALNAIITLLVNCTELAQHVDTEPLLEFAAFDDEAAWIAAPATVILCLMSSDMHSQLTELTKTSAFSTKRAILIRSLLPRSAAVPELGEWIPQRHPVAKLLSWISSHGGARSWNEFFDKHSDVDRWLRTLDEEDEFAAYTSWAIGRLLGDFRPLRQTLPEQFRFAST